MSDAPASDAPGAGEDLRDAQQRMQSVLAASEVGTWTYEIGSNAVVADENLKRMFGLSEADAHGGHIEAYLAVIHPQDRVEVERLIAEAVAEGSKYVAEYRILQKDGATRTVIARGSVVRDAAGKALRLPGVIVDITKRVAAEQDRTALAAELARQDRTMRTVLSSIADFAYIFDLEGRFQFVNQALLDLWGLELAQAVGKNFYELNYPPELAARLQEQIQQVIDTRTSLKDKTMYVSPEGVPAFYEYIFRPVFAPDGTVEAVAGSTHDISAAEAMFQELERSEENFRTLTETLPDMVWTASPEGRILWANSALGEFTDLKAGAVERLAYQALVHPEDMARVAATWARGRESGEPFCFEHRLRMPDGTWRWHSVRGRPARSADGSIYRWIGIASDVHEERELREKLERSETLFRHLADTIPQLAWMAQPDGEVTWYNRRWHEYTGATLEEMKGWAWQRVHDPDVLPEVMARWQESLRTGAPFDMTFPLRGADGIFRPFLTRVMPMRDEQGNILLWFGTNTDVSEQKQLIKEREELLGSERAARSAAERAGRMKDEFLATLSHELRTPLNAIFGWIHLMREDADDKETLAEGLNVIDRNVRVQKQLIEDLLDMSRIVSGKLRLEVRSIDPRACIEAAIETVAPAAASKGVRLDVTLDPGAGPLTGDPGRLQQIVWNLLSNAIKFTPPGGRVQVTLQRLDEHLEIGVADSGQGIGPEFLPYVFDRFRQAEGGTTRQHGGLGLGLSIVKQLVEMHGGSIEVKSAGLGQGAAFLVHLPLRPAHPPAAEEGSPGTHPPADPGDPHDPSHDDARPNLARLKVLVVDDEADAREILQRLLEDCGAEVKTAESAGEALTIIKAGWADVMLSDVGMPDMDGYELLRRVRALGSSPGGRTPAIALTAFARSEDRTRALRAGFTAHVAKPVEPAELFVTVAAVTGRTNPAG